MLLQKLTFFFVDKCTVELRACWAMIERALGGDANIAKYKMTPLLGTNSDIYGYLRIMKSE